MSQAHCWTHMLRYSGATEQKSTGFFPKALSSLPKPPGPMLASLRNRYCWYLSRQPS